LSVVFLVGHRTTAKMYDEFGNLKKKFRKKTAEGAPHSGAGAGAVTGGKALWEEDLKSSKQGGGRSQKGGAEGRGV